METQLVTTQRQDIEGASIGRTLRHYLCVTLPFPSKTTAHGEGAGLGNLWALALLHGWGRTAAWLLVRFEKQGVLAYALVQRVWRGT